MAVRNLTARFMDLRSGAKSSRGAARPFASNEATSDSGLLEQGDGSAGNWNAMRNTLPPLYVDKIEQTEEDIRKIQLKMRDLSALHTKRLMVTFDSDESAQEREIDMLTQDITEVFRHAEGNLKQIQRQDDKSATPQDLAVRSNMQKSMARKLQALSMSFRQSQKEYLGRVRAQKTGDEAFDFLNEETKKAIADAPDRGFTAQQLMILEETEQMVNERDEEITRIARSIEELAQIFKELAVLVIDQGTILDRIDFNMEQVLAHTTEGIQQLQKAEEHQKSALPLRCIVVLVLLIAILLAILIAKHADKDKKK